MNTHHTAPTPNLFSTKRFMQCLLNHGTLLPCTLTGKDMTRLGRLPQESWSRAPKQVQAYDAAAHSDAAGWPQAALLPTEGGRGGGDGSSGLAGSSLRGLVLIVLQHPANQRKQELLERDRACTTTSTEPHSASYWHRQCQTRVCRVRQ